MSKKRVKGEVSLGVLPIRVLESTIPTIKRVNRITRNRSIRESLDLINRNGVDGVRGEEGEKLCFDVFERRDGKGGYFLLMLPAISKMGRYMATMIPPTTIPRKDIMKGSKRLVRESTATSTSSS